MGRKHSRFFFDDDDDDDDDDAGVSSSPQPKRPRLSPPPPSSSSSALTAQTTPRAATSSHTGPDLLSPLSDELLIRILSHLSPDLLLSVAPVSRRFHRLADDSQLWKALYYARFVLPRAMRVPGFREGRGQDHKLHYKGKRTLWADGRLGGLVREVEELDAHPARRLKVAYGREPGAHGEDDRIHWKRQYKIRHNWARGKCAVEELKLSPDVEDEQPGREDQEASDAGRSKKMLVKVVEGLAVTADGVYGLRAWNLKTREVVAQLNLRDDSESQDEEEDTTPSCLAIDDQGLERGLLDISVGFVDGSFGAWQLSTLNKTLTRRYRHAKSSNGELIAMSYSHPYLLTATRAVLISLYTFEVPDEQGRGAVDGSTLENGQDDSQKRDGTSLLAPYLMTSLKSHNSSPPLALSIRKTANATVASIAYTFFTRRGWSIGIQDLHITPTASSRCAPDMSTRLAYTTPFVHDRPTLPNSPPLPPPISPFTNRTGPALARTLALQPPSQTRAQAAAGPTTLCYTHPYLLATLPDNTLILHLCTSTASALSISPGIRLWGHTSGISDAEITARGKAVSVSTRGDEMRVWELEGRPSGVRSRSVKIRPSAAAVEEKEGQEDLDWEERKNWVGFDDEMVIVLKEARGGRESLLVYDFT